MGALVGLGVTCLFSNFSNTILSIKALHADQLDVGYLGGYLQA